MEKTPIAFKYQEKEYCGYFSRVSGSGNTSLFHLMIDNFYQGQLFLSQNFGWRFSNQTGKFESYSEYFGEYITAWNK